MLSESKFCLNGLKPWPSVGIDAKRYCRTLGNQVLIARLNPVLEHFLSLLLSLQAIAVEGYVEQ
jgi:hypothetical protein